MNADFKGILIALVTGFITLIVWEAFGIGNTIKKYLSSLFLKNHRRKIFEFAGDTEIFISKPQEGAARDSDTFILNEFSKYLPKNREIISVDDVPPDLSTLKANLLIIGSPRYNIGAENIQKCFDLGFEFVFDSYDADPKFKILKIVNKYGDTFTSSKDLKIKESLLSADYGILFQTQFSNGKKIFWIAGIHGVGSVGIAKYILANPKEFLSDNSSKRSNEAIEYGTSWLFRIKYNNKYAIENFRTIQSVEIIANNSQCILRNIGNAPKNLIFDFGNVLMFFDRDRTYRALAKYINKSHEKIREILDGNAILKKYEKGEIESLDFYNSVLSLLDINQNDLSFVLFSEIYGDIFWLNKNIFEALKQLKTKVNLAILSNTNEIHFKSVSENYKEIFELFGKNIILSYEVKHLKPDKEIFNKALELFGSDSSYNETIYVDDLVEYIDAANKLGMKGLVYYRYTYFIYSLRKFGIYIP